MHCITFLPGLLQNGSGVMLEAMTHVTCMWLELHAVVRFFSGAIFKKWRILQNGGYLKVDKG